jgi:aryl carrier-like protein
VLRLQAVLAPLLGMRDPALLDPETPLLSFGLDSLTAVEFARALSRTLGRPVAPDFVYNHATLAQAARALNAQRPAQTRGFVLRAPRWVTNHPDRPIPNQSPPLGWTVAGNGSIAAVLRDILPVDDANLVDLGALDIAPSADRNARNVFFPALLTRLRPRLGKPARIVLVVGSGTLAGAVEGFATALAVEQPNWALRTIRLDPVLTDPVAALTRTLAADDAPPRLRLSRHKPEVMRLMDVDPRQPWRASPDATYLVTGSSGGIGGLVASHLVARGARHLVLASRHPVLPAALTNGPAQVRLYPIDLADAAALAAMMTELRTCQPRLRGIFHAAGVTADGTIAATRSSASESRNPLAAA